jgi:phosphonate transport system permease protein
LRARAAPADPIGDRDVTRPGTRAIPRLPWQLRWSPRLIALTVGAFALYALDHTGFFDFDRLLAGVGKLGWLFQFLFPPSHGGWFGEFVDGLLETLAMAFIGTLLAFVIAFPLGFLGARNVLPNWLMHFGLRRMFDGVRGVDTLIWALIFVNVVGLGPFAGILAIAVADAGTLAKLFAEAIENVDQNQVDGVRATGADRAVVVRFGLFPQIWPVMLSNTLYFFESNTRSASILGIVGAGGIGQHLSDRIRVNNWDEAAFIVIMILIAVYAIDLVSREIRLRIIGRRDYRP